MPIISNQIGNGQVTAANIVAELESRIKYVSSINAASFTDPKEIVNKAYVDAQILANIEGLDVKGSARAATTGNLQGLPSGAGVGAFIESLDPDFGDLTVEGVALAGGDRVLVKDQGGGVGQVEGFVDESAGNYRFLDTSEYGKFFEFKDSFGNDYYVWFNDGSALDPVGAPTPANQPTAFATGIEVTFAPASLAPAIVAATKTAIDTMGISGLTVVDYSPNLVLVWETQGADNDVTTLTDGNGAGAMPVTSVSQVLVGDADAVIGVRNGVYVYQDTAGNTQKWKLIRATDFDEDSEVTANAFLFVSEGDTLADTGWVLITNDPIVVDTTGQEWTQFSGVANLIAGEALLKTGNTLDVLYDDLQIGLNGSNQLELKNESIQGIKLNDNALNAFISGGFFVEDSVSQVSYLNGTVANRKPQFGASVALTGGVTGSFKHGEVVNFTSGAKGTFLGIDNIFAPTALYYLPTNATVPVAADTITGATSGATSTVNGTPNNLRGNTPDGVTTTFNLSIQDYITDESPSPAPEVLTSSLMVWRNGVLQKQNGLPSGGNAVDTYELTLSTGQIEFGVAPAYGEEILVRYIPRLAPVA